MFRLLDQERGKIGSGPNECRKHPNGPNQSETLSQEVHTLAAVKSTIQPFLFPNKQCHRCLEFKPIQRFPILKRIAGQSTGHICQDCKNADSRLHHARHKQKRNEKSRNYYQQHTEQVSDYKRSYMTRLKNDPARFTTYKQKRLTTERARVKRDPSIRQRQREQYHKARALCLSHYSNGTTACVCCGESSLEFLSIDHINGGGRQHRRRVGNVYPWLVRMNFPEGFRVLCHNCNFAFGKYGYCPHVKS